MRNSVAYGVLIVCTVANYSGGSGAEAGVKDPLAEAFQNLRPEEKTNFLAYSLAQGLRDWAESHPRSPKTSSLKNSLKSLNIPEESIEKFKRLNIPKESRRKLLHWTKREFNLTTNNVAELLRGSRCSGTICLPDIGTLCCPW